MVLRLFARLLNGVPLTWLHRLNLYVSPEWLAELRRRTGR